MSERTITAIEMAKGAGVDPRMFRRRLREARRGGTGLAWHNLGDSWTVREGSAHYVEMQRVLDAMLR